LISFHHFGKIGRGNELCDGWPSKGNPLNMKVVVKKQQWGNEKRIGGKA
jgi:hypothetical protein